MSTPLFLTDKIAFPSLEHATPEGVVAIGGDLSVPRLLLAYKQGIFPWFEDDRLIVWWSPPKRMVLFPEKFKLSKSLRQVLRKQTFTVSFNKAFDQVIQNCAAIKRTGQRGTWITPEMIKAYTKLHSLGHATSVEVWSGSELVGGLYGLALGHVFCGESMFAKASNASKVALYHLVEVLRSKHYALIDCQVHTKHMASLGAEEIDRAAFLRILHQKEGL